VRPSYSVNRKFRGEIAKPPAGKKLSFAAGIVHCWILPFDFPAMTPAVKPKLLVVELWGVGDLAIATPFLRAAAERYRVTLLAKPHALELQPRLWPGVRVEPWTAPWTAFRGKYQLWRWPWRNLSALFRKLRAEKFAVAVSARSDPRDHPVMKLAAAESRLGFSTRGSGIFLTRRLAAPDALAHRYEYWRVAADQLGFALPESRQLPVAGRGDRRLVLVHSGARISARVWPLAYYQELVARLRRDGRMVQVVCDPEQQASWRQSGETGAASPRTLTELLDQLDRAAVFIGNCSGPGHLAAVSGVPTFTFFGPSRPEWFAPLHPQAAWLEDKSCSYKPCKDYCHFSSPRCLENMTVDRAWPRIQTFVQFCLNGASGC
jgi:heptosyltransferase-2